MRSRRLRRWVLVVAAFCGVGGGRRRRAEPDQCRASTGGEGRRRKEDAPAELRSGTKAAAATTTGLSPHITCACVYYLGVPQPQSDFDIGR